MLNRLAEDYDDKSMNDPFFRAVDAFCAVYSGRGTLVDNREFRDFQGNATDRIHDDVPFPNNAFRTQVFNGPNRPQNSPDRQDGAARLEDSEDEVPQAKRTTREAAGPPDEKDTFEC